MICPKCGWKDAEEFNLEAVSFAVPTAGVIDLRDYFAGLAMQQFVRVIMYETDICKMKNIVLAAYKVADEMLMVRNKPE